jgi:hypothetical protein
MSTPFWQVWLGQTTNSNPQGSGSDASVNSNVLKQTYINRFLDVSGTFTVRYDASINGNLYLGPNSRLGLGVTAPSFILDQSGTARMQSPNSASYTSSPHTSQGNHGLVLTSTKATGGSAYSMGLGIDFSSGAGYITTGFNSSGTSATQPLILNATGGDVGIGYINPTAALFVVGNQTVTGSVATGTFDASAYYGNTVASFLNSVTAVGGGVSNAATIEIGALNRNILTTFATNTVYKYALTTSVSNSTGCDFEIKGITTGANAGLDGTPVSRLYISPAGNVGIGITNPAFKLDLRGTDTVNGTLRVGGNAITSAGNGVPGFSACTIIANGTAGTICNSTAGNGGLDDFQSKSPFNICDPGHSTYGIGLNMGIFRNTGAAYIQCQAANTGHRDICLQTYGGKVGIGTTGPAFSLHVASSVYGGVGAGYSYMNQNGGIGTAAANASQFISIKADKSVAAELVMNYSDIRIKKNIIDIDDLSALETLRLIEPKRYNYIDIITRPTEPVWGFIAQQVKSVLPHSTTLITDFIPNIYDIASVSSDGYTVSLTNKFTSDISMNYSPLVMRFFDKSNSRIEKDIDIIIDEKSFTVKTPFNENELIEDKIFVYGQQVDDFHSIDKSAIFTIATAALQEVDREYQITKQEVIDLKSRLNALETRLTAAGF